MKVGVLYYKNPQWTEEQLAYFFRKKGVSIDLIECGDMAATNFKNYNLILNRIYASVANENNFDFMDYIETLKKIEKGGTILINSSFASICDYDKDISSKTMRDSGILNPITKKVSNVEEIKNFIESHNCPVIVKPNTGGRGIDIMKFSNIEEVPEDLFKKTHSHSDNFIVQTLAKSIEPWDYRVFVIGKEILFANSRTLVDGWLGSRSQGSKIKVIEEVDKELKETVIKATKSIKSEMNSLDVVKTNEGYSVIENNPTPNFNVEYENIFGFNPVKKLVDSLIDKFSGKKDGEEHI